MNAQVVTMEPVTEASRLDILALSLENAKAIEKRARNDRLAAEQALIEEIGVKEEGTTSVKTDFYTIKTVGKITRTLNAKKLAELNAKHPELHKRFTRVKTELDTSAYKKLAVEDPTVYYYAAACVSAKPAKASVSVERIVS